MKKVALLAVVVGMVAFTFAENVLLKAGTNSVKMPVSSVTVFTDRALVERSAKISVPAGNTQLVVEYLPSSIDENSVRVSGTSAGKVILGGIEVLYQRWTPDTIRKIRGKLQTLKDRLAELKLREKGLSIRQDFLKSVAQLGGSEPDGDYLVIKPQNLSSTASFIKRELESIAGETTDIARQKRKVNRQIDSLQEVLNNMTGGNSGRGYKVIIPVNAETPSQLTLRVKYVVSGASWKPAYDARYDESLGKVRITYMGVVFQRTSEDWQDVKLVLSTSQPQIDTRPPRLTQWYLSVYQEEEYGGGGKLMALPMFEEKAMAGEQAAEESVEFQRATSRLVGETVVFDVPGKVSIPSDGQKHQVIIGEFDLDAEKKFVAVPAIAEKVYLIARCSNNTGFLLLPGKVSVFQGEDFVGTQWIDDAVGFGEKFEIAMGPVKTIEVQRRQVKKYRETTGIFGRGVKETFAYEIEVSNHSRSPVEVEVIDRIPVSQDEKISVENVKFEPQPAERNRDFEGQVVWNVKLQPGEKKKVKFQFSVKYPRDVDVEGL